MELRETIESVNQKLLSSFGRAFNGQPNFRVVWSNDQLEKRWMTHTNDGFQLIHPEVREVPKYKNWVPERFILERFIPIVGESDLVEKVGYEPAWVFQDRFNNYLPPYFDGCKFVIESILSVIQKEGTHVKYKDPLNAPEYQQTIVAAMETELFGNETPVGDALAYGFGTSVPENKLANEQFSNIGVAEGEDNAVSH